MKIHLLIYTCTCNYVSVISVGSKYIFLSSVWRQKLCMKATVWSTCICNKTCIFLTETVMEHVHVVLIFVYQNLEYTVRKGHSRIMLLAVNNEIDYYSY